VTVPNLVKDGKAAIGHAKASMRWLA